MASSAGSLRAPTGARSGLKAPTLQHRRLASPRRPGAAQGGSKQPQVPRRTATRGAAGPAGLRRSIRLAEGHASPAR
eukprot:7299171-Lingulodinium_polyedra.AAC.1